jgi:hypothetical protein
MKKKLTPWQLDGDAEYLCFDLKEIENDKVKYNEEINQWIINHLIDGLCVRDIASSLSMAFNKDYNLMINIVAKHKEDLNKKVEASKLIKLDLNLTEFTKETNNKQPEIMKKVRFYTKQEENDILEIAKDTSINVDDLAEIFAKKHNRSANAVKVKIYKIRKTLVLPKNIKFYSKKEISIIENLIIEDAGASYVIDLTSKLAVELDRPYDGLRSKVTSIKKRLIREGKISLTRNTRVNKVKPVLSIATIRAKRVLQDAKEPIVQEPAEIGVEVPHGMTFEGKPKKIMLHSDHFRIYF